MFNWSLGYNREIALASADQIDKNNAAGRQLAAASAISEVKVAERAAPAAPTGSARPIAELRGITYEEFQKMRDYASIAESIGFRPTQLVLTELYDFLEKQGIKIFAYGPVAKWLDSKKPKNIEHWCWRPLRKKDVIEKYRWGFERGALTPSHSGYYSSSLWECRQYASLVPQHALEKVEKISLKFGDEVNFFVSDFATPNLDPFIMARPAACDDGAGSRDYIVVFDMWDEPGF